MIRDWPGLAILFIMPAILLIIITFTQESAIPSKRSGMKIAIVDTDTGQFGRSIVADLTGQGYFNFIVLESEAEAREAVADGQLQMAVIIPEGSTQKLYSLLERIEGAEQLAVIENAGDITSVIILYDPAVQKLFRDAVIMPLNSLLQLSAVKILMTQFTDNVNRAVKEHTDYISLRLSDDNIYKDIPDFPFRQEVIRNFRQKVGERVKEGSEIRMPLSPSFSSAIVDIEEEPALRGDSMLLPGVLQNNIPAFTLFAMFFIVIPLAGSIINEKEHGTYSRVRTLPVSYVNIALSKITVFVIVCVLQFIFLMFVGKYIMPLLGEQSTIDLKVNIPALLAALICSSLSAIGFGIMVGSIASTHGQAATFGSVMVVILALLGGIFVPVHMLPDVIRKISFVSPLRWGTDAFTGVFVRHEGIPGIGLQLALLTSFFLISILLTVRFFKRE